LKYSRNSGSKYMAVPWLSSKFSKLAWSWFHEYLQARATEQFYLDHTFFTTKAFVESVGKGTLYRFITCHLLEIFSEKLTHELKSRKRYDLGKEMPDAVLDEIQDVPVNTHSCPCCHGGHPTSVYTASDEMSFKFPDASCTEVGDVMSLENSSVPNCAVPESLVEEVPPTAPAEPALTFDDIKPDDVIPDDGAPKLDGNFGDSEAGKSGSEFGLSNLGGWSSSWGASAKRADTWEFDDTTKSVDDGGKNPWDSAAKKKKASSDFDFDFNMFKGGAVPAPPVEEKPVAEEGWGSGTSTTKSKEMITKRVLMERPVPEPAPAPESEKKDEEDPWSFTFSGATDRKKKKKKKGKREDLEELPPPPPEPEQPVEPELKLVPEPVKDGIPWAFAGAPICKKGKKGKKRNDEPTVEESTVEEPPPPPAEPEPETEPAMEPELSLPAEKKPADHWDDWGAAETPIKKSKKHKKGAAVTVIDPEPTVEESVPEPEPEPEPILEAEPTEEEKNEGRDWGFNSIWEGGEKEKKKHAKSAKPEPESAGPLAVEGSVQQPDAVGGPKATDEDEWGMPPIYKKKETSKQKRERDAKERKAREKKTLHVLEEPDPTAGTEPAARQGAFPEPEQEHEPKPGSILEDYMSGTSSTLCPYRSHHLLEGNGWKSCNRCRAMLKEIAVQLAKENKTVLL
jgi:hypothetical protein